MNRFKASSFDKLIYFLVLPFFLWSFLGGHKQLFFGFSTDHFFTVLAFVASILIFIRYKLRSNVSISVLICFIFFVFISLNSLLLNEINLNYVYVLISSIVYFSISFFLPIFFREREEIFLKIIIFSSFFSSLIIIIFFIFIGMGDWGRMTIPVFVNGGFEYFPSGYESSSDPNVLAYFLGYGLLTTIYFKKDGIFSFFSLIMFCGIVLTLSRSALLSIFIVLIFCFYYIVKISMRDRYIFKTLTFIILFFIFLL